MLIYWARLSPIVIWLNRKRPKVLAYHACSQHEDDYIRGLDTNISPSVFKRHIRFFSEHYQLISLRALERGDYPERSVVITFDDGYRSVYDNAFPILQSFDATATIFLVAEAVNGKAFIWVNELNWLLHNNPVATKALCRRYLGEPVDGSTKEIIEAILTNYEQLGVQELVASAREQAVEAGWCLEAPDTLYMNWEHVEEMGAAGFEFGNHTNAHPNLDQLTEEQVWSEIGHGQTAVAERLGACTSFAYPFGGYADSAHEAAVRLGHSTLMELGGWNSPQVDLEHIARIGSAARSTAALFADLELVAPVRALLKRLAS